MNKFTLITLLLIFSGSILSSCEKTNSIVESKEIKKEIIRTNSWVDIDKQETQIKNVDNKVQKNFYLNLCKEQEKNSYNNIRKLKLSPDWKSYSYIANINNPYSNEYNAQLSILVKDWKEIKSKYWINDFIYSNNWKHFAYTEYDKDWEINIIKDWIEIKKWIDPTFSPDWKNFSYISNDNIGQILVKDWIKNNKYYYFDWLTYSPDWKSFSYIATLGNSVNWKKIVVKDWIEWMPYNNIRNLIYSPDSNHYAYISSSQWIDKIIKDWSELEIYNNKYSDIQNLKFSADSKEIYFSAKKNYNNKYVFINNWVESPEYDNIEKVIYSSNWTDYALVIKNNYNNSSSVVNSNWIIWTEYNSIISIKYSNDWANLAYLRRNNDRRNWWISFIVNWKELKKYKETIIEDFEFSPNNEGFILVVSNYPKWYKIYNTCKN